MVEQKYVLRSGTVADSGPLPAPPPLPPGDPGESDDLGVAFQMVALGPVDERFRMNVGQLWFRDRLTADAAGFKLGAVVKVEYTVEASAE